jgi:MFS family permease
MFTRLRSLYQKFPGQFWLMFSGMLISTIGASMIWPFLMIYVSKSLNAPMTTTASLLTLNAGAGLVASFLGGPVIDRFGRKWLMALSLALNGVVYIFMGHATIYTHFALLLGMSGAVNPLYRSAADAMMTDLVPAEKRSDGFALLRMSNNLGISIGPLIGGFIASASYTVAFYCAAAGMIAYSLLLAAFAHETLPQPTGPAATAVPKEKLGGYPAILEDRPFIGFVLNFTLATVCAILMWTLMPVYANRNYNVPENVYKWIPATNAIMVVTLQTLVTSITKRFRPLLVLAIGAFFYAIAVGSVAFAQGFLGFWICMVIMTVGELILVPTSSTYTASLAPVDKRGRYMSIYGLTWPIGAGLGPLFGGILNDRLGPQAIWYGGLIVGAISTLNFILLARRAPRSVELQLQEELT